MIELVPNEERKLSDAEKLADEYPGRIKQRDVQTFTYCVDDAVGKFEVIDRYYWQTTKKPKSFHRFFLKLLLGRKWTDLDSKKP